MKYTGNMACECNEVLDAHRTFKELILDQFRKYQIDIEQGETMLNRIRKIDDYLKQNNICDDQLSEGLMKFLGDTSSKIHINPSEFNPLTFSRLVV